MLFSCKNDIKTIHSFSKYDTLPLETIYDAVLFYSDSGVLVAKLTTPLMEHYNVANPYMELPQGVKIVFFDSLKRVSSILTANYAKRYEKQQIMEAKKDVVVINEKKEKLNTEHLIWNEAQHTIYSNEFVKITTEDKVIFGEGIISDERFDVWKIIKPRGDFFIKKDNFESDTDSSEVIKN